METTTDVLMSMVGYVIKIATNAGTAS